MVWTPENEQYTIKYDHSSVKSFPLGEGFRLCPLLSTFRLSGDNRNLLRVGMSTFVC